jgi:hypothetical protein
MVSKPTGRRRGRPIGTIKSFLDDDDRYVVGMVFGLLPLVPAVPKEYLIMLAIYFHEGRMVELPPEPLKASNRLKLSDRVKQALQEGYRFAVWSGNEQQIENHTDRIKKKITRLAQRDDPPIQRWLYYARLGWSGMLAGAPPEFVLARFEQIDERDYAEHLLIPRFAKQFLLDPP